MNRKTKPTTNAIKTNHQLVRYFTIWLFFTFACCRTILTSVSPLIFKVLIRSRNSIFVWNLVFGISSVRNIITVSRYEIIFSQTMESLTITGNESTIAIRIVSVSCVNLAPCFSAFLTWYCALRSDEHETSANASKTIKINLIIQVKYTKICCRESLMLFCK